VGAAGVVGHQVQEDGDAALAGLRDQLVHVGKGAEIRVHAQVVGDVVSPVRIG
jgi:hypothetical protein